MDLPKNLDEFRESARTLLDDWVEPIPAEIIHSDHPVYGLGPKFKCRRIWFQAIINYAEAGLDAGFLPRESNAFSTYQDFLKYLDDSEIRKRLTTEEDIRQGNKVLTAILSDCKGR